MIQNALKVYFPFWMETHLTWAGVSGGKKFEAQNMKELGF
jgi:hypothetical protein